MSVLRIGQISRQNYRLYSMNRLQRGGNLPVNNVSFIGGRGVFLSEILSVIGRGGYMKELSDIFKFYLGLMGL